MRICLVCEGCYPYVIGGVSSWVQQLIKNFPEYEFSVYAISADSSSKGKFIFEIPENVSEIQEVFLTDGFKEESYDFARHSTVKAWEIAEFKKLLLGDIDRWDFIFDFFARGNHIVAPFLMSTEFYSIVKGVYNKKYSKTIYLDFLWTMRSMYLTLFHILNNPPHRADIYHCVSTGYAGIAGALAKRIYGGKLIITEHGIYTREREEEIIKSDWVLEDFKGLWVDYFRNLSKGAYNSSDSLIALFETNNKIQIENGANPVICDTIANGIKYENFDNIPRKGEEDKDILNVGAVIRVSPIKDIKTMLYSFDIVKKKIPNTRFYIMGPIDEVPEYYQECIDLLNELGTKDIIFTGRIDIKEYIGKMDVMVLTSLSEGQPLALMEAMAASIPCVSTNVGSCGELFNGRTGDNIGPSGLLAPIMNHEKIADNIIKIITNPRLAKQYGLNGRKRIEDYYSEEKFRQAYKELYRKFDISPTMEEGKKWRE